ncbi:MAG: efflux RND transporter periplasmic adaptor subunit [Bacteroidota bacterium]|nr:efflux RND transporter periplasmic adaptor subunit [Bacteroidota bacterium]
MKKYLLLSLIVLTLFSCKKEKLSDAYGNFFANEIIISGENNGKIINSYVNEGDKIQKGDTLAVIDNKMLILQKNQILAKKKTISTKFENIIAQVNVLKEQKSVLETECDRIENLLKDSAVSKQKYDNIVGKINILDQQINAAKAGNSSIFGELDALDASIELINEQISKCLILAPINGVILEKYINKHELCYIGKPIYKIADLSIMELTVYVSEDQLSSIKIGQEADIIIDNPQEWSPKGKVKWISNTAEFTPKIIQTKKERVNLVYAVKIDVANNGSLKIGMPGEANFVQ